MIKTQLCDFTPYVRMIGSSFRHKEFLPYRRATEISNTFIYVNGGRGTHIVNNVAYPLMEGAIEIVPAFSDQVIIVDEGDYLDIRYIFFDLYETEESRKIIINNTFKETIRHTSAREMFFWDKATYAVTSQGDHVNACMDEITRLREEEDLASSLRVKALLLELLAVFIEESRLPPPESTHTTKRWDYLTNAMHFIKTNFHNPLLDNRMISEFADVSPAYLAKLFKTNLNIGIAAYVRDVRMDYAKELLSGGKSVSEVAKQCGYQSIQSFTRAFKRIEGLSPSEYGESLGKR